MSSKKTSNFENGLIWVGAAASLAEILTGTLIAPLGFEKGLYAILIGHFIGCVLLVMSGIIGGKSRKSSMEAVKMSFGKYGSLIFSVLNVIQLAGWTAIMIYDGAIAANSIFRVKIWFWAIVIGLLIILWIMIGLENLGKLNTIAMSMLFILTVVLGFVVFRGGNEAYITGGEISFGLAVELSVAMPLSWLPLISDYTKEAKMPVSASAVSGIAYFIMSSWMYVIGMGAAIFAGTDNIVDIILKSGMGIAGLIIILTSTVSTTFMDAYSTGASIEAICPKVNGKLMGVVVTAVGVISAISYPIADISDFLYLIGSVFAPMIAIQIAEFFVLKGDFSNKNFKRSNLIIWLTGFICYRFLMRFDIVIGNTVPSMFLTFAFCVIVNKIIGRAGLK